MQVHPASKSVEDHGCATSQGIREWRESIETFFTNDWQKVRDMVLGLEESLWEETEGSPSKPLSSQGVSSQQELQAAYQAAYDSIPGRTPVSPDPEQKRRLESLAKRIGQRLQRRPQ